MNAVKLIIIVMVLSYAGSVYAENTPKPDRPAKLNFRTPPKYPSTYIDEEGRQTVSGWVKLSFDINSSGDTET